MTPLIMNIPNSDSEKKILLNLINELCYDGHVYIDEDLQVTIIRRKDNKVLYIQGGYSCLKNLELDIDEGAPNNCFTTGEVLEEVEVFYGHIGWVKFFCSDISNEILS